MQPNSVRNMKKQECGSRHMDDRHTVGPGLELGSSQRNQVPDVRPMMHSYLWGLGIHWKFNVCVLLVCLEPYLAVFRDDHSSAFRDHS